MARNGNKAVELSVVIATHNRRDLLRRCLESLAAQAADSRSFEVLVAADGCTDGSAEMAEAFEAPFELRVLRLEKGRKSAALNAAIEAAEGRLCLFLDDDIVASPELVSEHAAAQSGGQILGIGAIIEQPPPAPDWFERAFATGWAEHNEDLLERPARWTDCYGANLSAPRSALREVGGFTTGLAVAEDFDVGFRLWKAGCEPRFVPGAVGVHDDDKRCGQMLKDARRQGAVHVELANRFPETARELLDWSSGAGPRELALRRLCLALRLPPRGLAWLGRLLPGDGRRMVWLHFVRSLAFWQGVRRAATAPEWAALTDSPGLASGQAAPASILVAADLLEVVPI